MTTYQEVYQFFLSFCKQNRIAPTLRDIQKQFGFASPNAAAQHVDRLVKKGLIQKHTDGRLLFPSLPNE